jgi:hypothetical protein
MGKPSELIDRQVEAYNRRELDDFVACYAPTARIIQPDGSLLAEGHHGIRVRYGELFKNSPSLHAVIRTRIEVGSVVIDEELVTGFVRPGMPPEVHAAVAYSVRDDLVHEARLVRTEQLGTGTLVDLDVAGQVVGIEVLNPARAWVPLVTERCDLPAAVVQRLVQAQSLGVYKVVGEDRQTSAAATSRVLESA